MRKTIKTYAPGNSSASLNLSSKSVSLRSRIFGSLILSLSLSSGMGLGLMKLGLKSLSPMMMTIVDKMLAAKRHTQQCALLMKHDREKSWRKQENRGSMWANWDRKRETRRCTLETMECKGYFETCLVLVLECLSIRNQEC